MRILSAAAVVALLAGLVGPAYAQEAPHINLISELPSKTPEEKEAETARDRAYKESLRKIPETKAVNDPWGNVRTAEPPKSAAPAKPRTKTGNAAN
ncbi:MAG TPA: hypothetical protein VGD13_02400 [Xanthobacteraceae bacterium]